MFYIIGRGIFQPLLFSGLGSSLIFYIIIAFIAALIISVPLVLIYIYSPQLYNRFFDWIKKIYHFIMHKRYFTYKQIEKEIHKAGYIYDEIQDVFYSAINAWQRKFGYCRLYDEACAPLGMIVDSEPIYFDFEGKKWLIEFWKGQYDMTLGAEVGIYNTKGPEINVPGLFNGTLYNSVKDEDFLPITFTLKKKGRELFTMDNMHWWLTGFRLGEFAEPSELSMEISITLKNRRMRNTFWIALNEAGYSDEEIYIRGNTVSLVFDKPKSRQPLSRTMDTDFVIQRKNEQLCLAYQEVTKGCKTMPEKLMAVQEKAPDMLQEILNIGKGKPLYEVFKKLKKIK